MKYKSGPGAELLHQEKSDKYDFIFTNWYTYPVVCQWWNNRRPHWVTENLPWLVSSKKTKLAIFPALQYRSGNFTVVGFLAFFFGWVFSYSIIFNSPHGTRVEQFGFEVWTLIVGFCCHLWFCWCVASFLLCLVEGSSKSDIKLRTSIVT